MREAVCEKTRQREEEIESERKREKKSYMS